MLGLWGLVVIVWILAGLCGLHDFVVGRCLVGFGFGILASFKVGWLALLRVFCLIWI